MKANLYIKPLSAGPDAVSDAAVMSIYTSTLYLDISL